jgi:ABC-type sugar transport system ATPase subunit
MGAISIRDVFKRYGKGPGANLVIHGVNAEVADGEFVVIVGPSGCGKSTLLRMVAGLEEISGGEIAIGGRVVNNTEPSERDIAMVFQNYALYPHMSVFDNMAYGLKIKKVPVAEIKTRVDKAARILELGTLLQRKPRELSGGQRQRVAMGRAIVRQPQVFLFDEPLSNLDAALRVQMRLELSRLHKELRTTMIYVTHDQVEAMTLGQRIAVFNQGRIEQVGTPLQLYDAPANRFVAGFLGSPKMNFIRCKALAAGGSLKLHFDDGFSAELPWRLAQALPGIETMLGLRPERLRMTSVGAGMRGRIELVENLGDVLIAYVRVAGADQLVAVKSAQTHGTQPEAGQEVALQPDLQHGLLFDPDGRAVMAVPEAV